MPPIAELLFVRNWWSWNDQDPSWHSVVVHWFNLFEGCVWCVFAALVYFRYRKHRHSSLELVYAAAFLLFGATDFVEAFSLTSWLMWIKLVTLIALWRLRRSFGDSGIQPAGSIERGRDRLVIPPAGRVPPA